MELPINLILVFVLECVGLVTKRRRREFLSFFLMDILGFCSEHGYVYIMMKFY